MDHTPAHPQAPEAWFEMAAASEGGWLYRCTACGHSTADFDAAQRHKRGASHSSSAKRRAGCGTIEVARAAAPSGPQRPGPRGVRGGRGGRRAAGPPWWDGLLSPEAAS